MQNVNTIDIRGRAYVTVAERVRLVHEQKRAFEIIESTAVQIADRWLWRSVVKIDGSQYIGTAEVKLNAPKNTPDGTSPFECAETSAIGRALGMAGFGSVDSIASFDEVYRVMATQEAQQQQPPQVRRESRQPVVGNTEPGSISDTQKNALLKFFGMLDRTETPDMSEWSYTQAAQAIRELQAELKKPQQKAS